MDGGRVLIQLHDSSRLSSTRFIVAFSIMVGLSFAALPISARAEQTRGVELTRIYFYDLDDVDRKFIQLTLKGYDLYDGPVDGILGFGTYKGMKTLADLLGREEWQSDHGYDIGHPQGISLLFEDIFSGRAFDVFPYPSKLTGR